MLKKITSKISIKKPKTFPIKLTILILIITLLMITLFPIFQISQYNYPSADDYGLSAGTKHTLDETGSPIKAVLKAFNKAKTTYFSWQGTFSAIFLMAMQPTVWGEGLYFLTTLILILSFIACTLFFSYQLLVKYFKADKKSWLIISLTLIIISIQFVESPVEAFFWFNGAIFYTFFYSLSILLFGIIIAYMLSNKKRAALKYSFIVLPLAFFVGGGNYVTALSTAAILFIFAVYLFIKKNKKKIPVTVAFVILLAGFIISIAAPGNARRQMHFESIMPIDAILKSFDKGARHIISYSSKWPIIISFIFCIPFLLSIIRKTNFKFHYPILIFVLSFGLFSMLYTPTLYAMGGPGAHRIGNMRFYVFLWFMILNIFYLCGWIWKKAETICCKSEASIFAFNEFMAKARKKYVLPILLSCIVLSALSFYTFDYEVLTSVSAAISLENGEAEQYSKEMEIRLEKFNSDEQKITVKPLTVKPYVLLMFELGKPPDWRNSSVAGFYKKESVELE